MQPYIMFADASGGLAKVIVPAIIVGVFVGLLFTVWAMTKRYKRIPPNAIGVIYGKRRTQITDSNGQKTEVGFRLVSGGAVFIMPLVESYAEMSTEAFQIEISEDNIPSKQNVGVTVSGVATCRISPVPEEQMNAVQNFLGKPLDEIKRMNREILRGHLRSIVGSLEIEELLRQRSKFNEMVIKECGPELSRMGIRVLTLVIQDVRDKEGYIEALGKQAVAIAKRDAVIATAEAERESTVKSSDAARTAAEAKATNDALIKAAEKDRDVKVAQFKLETASKQAEADMAGEIAKTAQQQRLVVLQAERDAADVKARTQVQELEAARKKKELEATTIVTAEATARANVIKAEGERNAKDIEAETRQKVAERNAQTARLEAEGKKNALILEGEGEAKKKQTIAEAEAIATTKTQTALAEGTRQTLLATAEGTKATKLAEAEGTRMQKLAEAEGQEKLLLAQAAGREKLLLAEAAAKLQSLLAEAQGVDKMAEALGKMSSQAQIVLIMDRLPPLIEKTGVAGEKIMAAIFANLAKPMERMGPITINDLGGGNTAKNGMEPVADMVPSVVAKFFARAKMSGIDMTPIFKVLRIDPAELAKMVAPLAATIPDAPVAPAVPDTPLTADGATRN